MEAACPFCAVATPEGFSVCLTHAAAPATAASRAAILFLGAAVAGAATTGCGKKPAGLEPDASIEWRTPGPGDAVPIPPYSPPPIEPIPSEPPRPMDAGAPRPPPATQKGKKKGT